MRAQRTLSFRDNIFRHSPVDFYRQLSVHSGVLLRGFMLAFIISFFHLLPYSRSLLISFSISRIIVSNWHSWKEKLLRLMMFYLKLPVSCARVEKHSLLDSNLSLVICSINRVENRSFSVYGLSTPLTGALFLPPSATPFDFALPWLALNLHESAHYCSKPKTGVTVLVISLSRFHLLSLIRNETKLAQNFTLTFNWRLADLSFPVTACMTLLFIIL